MPIRPSYIYTWSICRAVARLHQFTIGRKVRIILVADNSSGQFGGEAFILLIYFSLLRESKADNQVRGWSAGKLVERFPEQLHSPSPS